VRNRGVQKDETTHVLLLRFVKRLFLSLFNQAYAQVLLLPLRLPKTISNK
jgi:hypothetical protein